MPSKKNKSKITATETTATVAAKPSPAAASRAKPATRALKPEKKSGTRGLSGLDAAAKILAERKQPMNCQDLVTAMIAKGHWSTKGKTPAATLSSALLREIKSKGKQSRFRKTGRGLFTVNA